MGTPYYDGTLGALLLPGAADGAAEARIPLPSAPVGAMKLEFVFRAWFHEITDTVANAVLLSPYAWNHCSAFGLSFDGAIPQYPSDLATPDVIAPDGFLGWCNPRPFYDYYGNYGTAGTYAHAVAVRSGSGDFASPSGYNSASSNNQPMSFFDGLGTAIDTDTGGAYGMDYKQRARMALPKNAALGATYTFGWRVWGSQLDKTVYLETAYNDATLAEDDSMFGVFDAPSDTSNEIKTIHGDVASTWRVSQTEMAFPEWFLMRYALPTHGMVFRRGALRYYDIDDNLLPVPA